MEPEAQAKAFKEFAQGGKGQGREEIGYTGIPSDRDATCLGQRKFEKNKAAIYWKTKVNAELLFPAALLQLSVHGNFMPRVRGSAMLCDVCPVQVPSQDC